jgi:hypothetical protein
MSVVGPIAAKKLQGRECSEVPLADIGTNCCESRGDESTLALGLDFGLGGRILSGTEFCLTARNTASARLSPKRARTRIELAFRAKSVLVERSRK